jgi:hypothetical protein
VGILSREGVPTGCSAIARGVGGTRGGEPDFTPGLVARFNHISRGRVHGKGCASGMISEQVGEGVTLWSDSFSHGNF